MKLKYLVKTLVWQCLTGLMNLSWSTYAKLFETHQIASKELDYYQAYIEDLLERFFIWFSI